jgi:hypothetical protein|nr:MAG TPA: Portal protein [Caudoviricetes sp.]
MDSKNSNTSTIKNNKEVKRKMLRINNLIGKANLNLYGTDRTSDIDNLNAKFQTILNDNIGDITNRTENDVSSFLSHLVSNRNKDLKMNEILNSQLSDLTGNNFSSFQSFIYDAYRNRILEQSDLHEVSSQLIELSEAILITRDAIISADVVEGRLNRTISFGNIDDTELEGYNSIVEQMEKKFELQEKIKNFIIPKTLEYGEYYVYVIPYSKLFNDFSNIKNKKYGSVSMYGESVSILNTFNSKKKEESVDYFIENCYKEYYGNDNSNDRIPKEEFKDDVKGMLSNIEINSSDIPLPVMEEGIESIMYMKENFKYTTEDNKNDKEKSNTFANLNDGLYEHTPQGPTTKRNYKRKNEFSDINDCYVKLINPTKIVPIEIMNTTLGYVYIQADSIPQMAGAVTSTLEFSKFDEHSRQATLIDSIAERVALSFDKPFLRKNIKFKEAIVDCINYYNLNENKLKMQFIPAEYIVPFKIDKDENGRGTSMIKKSLFYAKLYLMLLLFKIMSIILYSNDQKINYVKQSGIDKNIVNKVEEIIRVNQSRQINITDLFSYTTLVNKVGAGNAIYMPVGRSGERPVETEILSGQDIQLNNDLMEMLKNSYILGTGVPNAILNYLQEVDFAKIVEQNNTKFNGRVVNYQLDFNDSITTLYKKIMGWSVNIPEHVVSSFKFALQAPKATPINTKNELIGQFQTLSDFAVNLIFEDANNTDDEDLQGEIREFKLLLAREQLPMIDFDKMLDNKEKAAIKYKEKKYKPKSSNGDDGDDIGLEEDLANMED